MYQSTINRILKVIKRPGKYFYIVNRRKYLSAPYSLEVYRKLIDTYLAHNLLNTPDFGSLKAPKNGKANLYIRHDIDMLACAENFGEMLKITLDRDLRVGIYFLVTDRTYKLEDYKKEILHYKSLGVEVGLHTECYRHDDFMQEFERETKRFEQVLGFRPRSFTVHGLGKERLETRISFYKELEKNFEATGYELTDCISGVRKYDYIIQDCHLNAETGNRYVYKDFKDSLSFIRPGDDILILTHPCYWYT